MISSSSTISFFIIFITATISFSSPGPEISYSDQCASFVPEATPTTRVFTTYPFLEPITSHYTGGERILGKYPSGRSDYSQKSILFAATHNLFKTNISGVYSIQARLSFTSSNIYYQPSNYTDGIRGNYSRIHNRQRPLVFFLNGFWSLNSRKLCMVGSAPWYSKQGNHLKLEGVLKLNFARNLTVLNSLISGILESSTSPEYPNYFDPISILGFPRVTPHKYNYTLVSDEGCSGGSDYPQNSSLHIESIGVCSIFTQQITTYELKYPKKCNSSQNCTPFGGEIGYLPTFVSLYAIQCSESEKKLRFLIEFRNSSYFRYDQSFNPQATLIGEGWWDGTKDRLCIVACRILNQNDPLGSAHVGDCSIRLSLRYPAVVSIRKSNIVEGQIWTNKTTNNSGFFETIKFRSSADGAMTLPGLKYEYTELEKARKSCPAKKPANGKGGKYPEGNSQDMWLDMSVKHSKKILGYGYAAPIDVGNHFYGRAPMMISNYKETLAPVSSPTTSYITMGPLNVSYEIGFTPQIGVKFGGGISSLNLSSNSNGRVDIFAEGVYNSETGELCMVGCRKLASNDSMDCEILVKLQFPPKRGGFIKGSIESTRNKKHALHFERLEILSTAFTHVAATRSIWRMDLEIIMVLISNTLLCIFVGLQLFHVKKKPEVLPFISLVMLLILTLGHMIPLMLNFEALFWNSRNRQNVMLGSGGWVEVNEVIVRIVTMVAFLLQFRLLQLVWTGKVDNGNGKSFWTPEIKTLFLSLLVYILGGSVALLVSWKENRYENLRRFSGVSVFQQHSIWGDLRSYAGLVLDGFLFPQIILNVFQISKERALSYSFYIGTTLVRLLPHAYDLYRGNNYVRQQFDKLYIYANPRADFYSASWDVVITCGGALLAMIIFLQQRFGGRCFLPWRFWQSEEYDKVPVVSTE